MIATFAPGGPDAQVSAGPELVATVSAPLSFVLVGITVADDLANAPTSPLAGVIAIALFGRTLAFTGIVLGIVRSAGPLIDTGSPFSPLALLVASMGLIATVAAQNRALFTHQAIALATALAPVGIRILTAARTGFGVDPAFATRAG